MSLTRQVQQVVKATPGLTTREIAAALGITDTKGVSRVSALLGASVTSGKVSRDVKLGKVIHFPTDLIDTDLRTARAKARAEAKAAKPKARRETAAKRPAKGGKPKPSAEQVAQLSALFGKRTRLRPTAHAGTETVEQFLARGGEIEILPPSACSRPLSTFEDEDILP